MPALVIQSMWLFHTLFYLEIVYRTNQLIQVTCRYNFCYGNNQKQKKIKISGVPASEMLSSFCKSVQLDNLHYDTALLLTR